MATNATFTEKAGSGTLRLPTHVHNMQHNTLDNRDSHVGGNLNRHEGARFDGATTKSEKPNLTLRQFSSSNRSTQPRLGLNASNDPSLSGVKKSLVQSGRNVSSTLVLCRGLPGSGKSTKAGVLAEIGYKHFEADMYFERDGNYQYDSTRIREAHEWCKQSTREALNRGENVVVSNTFTRVSEMAPYFEMGAGSLRIIEARGRWNNLHGVSTEAVLKMAARWESLPSTYS